MKKFIAGALVCLFGISLFLVGCTSGNVNSNPSQEEKIKLTMWSCDGSPAYVDPLQKFADDYMAMHENVEIEIVGTV